LGGGHNVKLIYVLLP